MAAAATCAIQANMAYYETKVPTVAMLEWCPGYGETSYVTTDCAEIVHAPSDSSTSPTSSIAKRVPRVLEKLNSRIDRGNATRAIKETYKRSLLQVSFHQNGVGL